MNKRNLTTKNIREFKQGDTIYIRRKREFGGPLYLCEFLMYDKGFVHGKAIWKEDADIHQQQDIEKGLGLKTRLQDCALYGESVSGSKHAHFHWFGSQGYAYHPLEEHKVSESGGTYVAKHPSYGVVNVSRSSYSKNQALFGSSILASNVIRFEISSAEVDRTLNNDYIHATKSLIEFEMTQVQFAEMMTTMNYGSGVPCTIRKVEDEIFPSPPYNSKVSQFQSEFKNKMHNIAVDVERTMSDATDMLKNKDYITKKDREQILHDLEMLVQNLKSNVPYIAGQFTEQMDKTVGEAKSEVEAYYTNVVKQLGDHALKSGITLPNIDEPKKLENE
jgi:hypothetical protein